VLELYALSDVRQPQHNCSWPLAQTHIHAASAQGLVRSASCRRCVPIVPAANARLTRAAGASLLVEAHCLKRLLALVARCMLARLVELASLTALLHDGKGAVGMYLPVCGARVDELLH
jgi:hypothetical protein